MMLHETDPMERTDARFSSALGLFSIRPEDGGETWVVGLTLGQMRRLGIDPDARYGADDLKQRFYRARYFPVWLFRAAGTTGGTVEPVGKISLIISAIDRVEHFRGMLAGAGVPRAA